MFTNQFDNQGRMRILDGMRYYKKTLEENNMVRFTFTMKEPIELECMQYATEKAFERFRVFRLTVVNDHERYYLRENNVKPVVRQIDWGKQQRV